MVPSYGIPDQNPVTSPASREHGNYSQRSTNKQAVASENPQNKDGKATENKGETIVTERN